MPNEREELTESERVWLDCPGNQTWPNITRKALRIIDAHAAEVAALVAQLEAAEQASAQRLEAWQTDLAAADREHEALVRIADEKRALVAQLEAAERDRTSLSEALSATQERQRRLTRERDEAWAKLEAAERREQTWVGKRVRDAEAEVTRLRSDLAEAEAAAEEAMGIVLEKLSAAEARVRELEADIGTERDRVRRLANNNIDTKVQLAAANALLAEAKTYLADPGGAFDAHLAAQPATAPVRTGAEQRVLDAMASLSDEWLRSDWCTWRKVADAELARRSQ